MTKAQLTGRILLTISLALTLGMGLIIDWTVSHWVAPNWPAHARFHLLMYHGSIMLFGITGLWGLWRFRHHTLSALAVYFVILAIWLPFFPAALVESASAIAVPEDVVMGIPANLVAGSIHLIVSTIGFVLARNSD